MSCYAILPTPQELAAFQWPLSTFIGFGLPEPTAYKNSHLYEREDHGDHVIFRVLMQRHGPSHPSVQEG